MFAVATTTTNNQNSVLSFSSTTTKTNTIMSSSTTADGLSLLSAKLNALDLEERNNALHDIHGVRDNDTFEETPDFLQSKINDLQSYLLDCIANYEPSETEAYRTAMELNSQYVQRQYLKFLRVDMFDSKATSLRLIHHFKFKHDLFGRSKLCEDITYNDLQSSEQEVLKSGFIQLLPCRDRAGRTTIFFDGNVSQQFPDDDVVFRAFFWFTMSITEDVDTQRKGIAVIYWSIAQKQVVNMKRMKEFAKWGDASPIRLVSHHVCMDKSNVVFEKFLNVLMGVVENKKLARVRFHAGTSLEAIYNLLTFGFPREAIPITDLGFQNVLNNKKMLELLKSREKNNQQGGAKMMQEVSSNEEEGTLNHDNHKDDSTTPEGVSVSPESSELYEGYDNVTAAATTITQPAAEVSLYAFDNRRSDGDDDEEEKFVLVPAIMDIIIGKRGQQPNKRPGLLRMHNLISEYQQQYESTPRHKKLDVTKIVLNDLQKSGCRFLVDESTGDGYGGYRIATEPQKLEKISHAFRNLRTKQNKLQQKQQKQSSHVMMTGSNKTKAPPPPPPSPMEETNLFPQTSTGSGGSNKKQRSEETTTSTDFDPIPFERLKFF